MSFHFNLPSAAASRDTFQFVSRPLLQRKCACGGTPGPTGECDECRRKRLNRRTDNLATPGTAPAIVHDVLSSPGRPLDRATRGRMEERFGHDFSEVRIHADATAGKSARAVNARAYTVGSNVVFAPGEYAAGTAAGRSLLSHELTHVIQQRGRSTTRGAGLLIAPTNDIFERQAEGVGDSARDGVKAFGGSMPSALATPALQRAEGDTAPPAKDPENGCAGWLDDRESTTKRAAEVYVRSELKDDHGEVVSIGNCSPAERKPADFACSVTFKSGLTTRVIVSRHTIVVGVEPLNAPGPEKPICYYDFKCPEPSRDLVLTKRKCITKMPKPAP